MENVKNSLEILESILEIIGHIKSVESDIQALSKDSFMAFGDYFANSVDCVPDNVATALQSQDIISQQLSATIEALDDIEKSIKLYKHSFKQDTQMVSDNLDRLKSKLNDSLQIAKQKQEAYMGNAKSGHCNIDFFDD